MSRPRLLIPALLLLLFGLRPAAAQYGTAYCNVTAVNAKQLSNGLILSVESDGNLEWDWDIDRMIANGSMEWKTAPEGYTYVDFADTCTRLSLRVWNARSSLGAAIVPINKYPVSHVEISVPDWATLHDGVGLCIDVVTYLGWMTGEGDSRTNRYDFDMQSAENQQQVMLVWKSDRFAPPAPPKTPEDLPSELKLTPTPVGFTLHAVNAPLREVMQVLSVESGVGITTAQESDLRVSCCLRNLPPEAIIAQLARGCGLYAGQRPDGAWLVTAKLDSSAGYATIATRRIPLRHLRAREAQDLLPNFLLDFLTADDATNTLAVTGPEWLCARVAEDVARLDTAPREVELEVTSLEYNSAGALARALRLAHASEGTSFAFDPVTGDVSFARLPGLAPEWQAVSNALQAESAGGIQSRTTLRVASGRTGRIFAGQRRTLILEQLYSYEGASLQTVDVGTSLKLTPVLGSGEDVLLALDLSLDSLSSTDPASGLPVIARRNAVSHLRVRNGETILIAGLEIVDDGRTGQRVPFLSRLPLLGGLFRAPYHSGSHTRLAIFVTPHLLPAPPAGKGETRRG